MKSEKRDVQKTPLKSYHYPLREICGEWESQWGSPAIRIYHDGTRFRLDYEYHSEAAFTFPIEMDKKGNLFFCFYGKMLLTYNNEEDRLTHSMEGEYKRMYDEGTAGKQSIIINK